MLAEPARRAWVDGFGGAYPEGLGGGVRGMPVLFAQRLRRSNEVEGGRWGDGEMGSKEWESMESGGVLNFEFRLLTPSF
jgi:hypothetical protein